MSIQSLALKTATLIALISVALPAPTQQLSTTPVIKNADQPVATSQTVIVPTTIVLTISTASPLSYGEDVGGYALVNSSDGSTLSGTVTFYDGTTNICTIPVTQTTSCPASAGTGFITGPHMLTATYSGDATHQGSTSNGVPVVVVPDITTLSLISSVNPASYGDNITFTATAQGDHATPTGQIEFLDGENLIATATLNAAGTASITQSALALGTHPITARYAATQNFGAAASAILNQVIQTTSTIATSTTLASSVNPAAIGQSITFTASVVTIGQALVPSGTVTFLDGGAVLGAVPLNGSGLATLTTSSLAAGSHAISVSYAGSGAASSSTPLTETVSGGTSSTSLGPFTLTIAGTPNVIAGEGVNLIITVAPRASTIQPVQLSCAGLPAESACTFGTPTLPANGGTTSLQISTMSPHSCASDKPYSQNAEIPFTAPALAGFLLLFLPRRRYKSMKNLFMILVAVCAITSLMGCGNCSDLGTRPGDYTVQVIGTSTGTATSKVITKITLHVAVP